MKKVGLGIAILLFAILFKLCSSGMDAFVFLLGAIGLGISILGSFCETEK